MILLQFPLNQPGPVALTEAIALLVLSALLGWGLGRLTLSSQIRLLREAITTGQAHLDECRQTTESVPGVAVEPSAASSPAESVKPVLTTPTPVLDLALPPVETLIPAVGWASETANDDLKILEGVGPRIEELLHDAGIKTFGTLATTPPSRLREILDGAGPRYQIHDPETWPEQARFAAEERWDELRTWQRELNRGKIR